MLESLRDQSPAPNERIAQDEGVIVPDEAVAQGGRIGSEDEQHEEKDRKKFLQRENQIGQMGVIARLSLPMFIATLVRASIFAFLFASSVHAAGVPDDCTQLLLGVAPDWNAAQGEMRLYERERGGPWKQRGAPIAVLIWEKRPRLGHRPGGTG